MGEGYGRAVLLYWAGFSAFIALIVGLSAGKKAGWIVFGVMMFAIPAILLLLSVVLKRSSPKNTSTVPKADKPR